ncbi:MAG: ATP-dependent 6-phosphofructokinase [Proteobacteria bacterium]|nr:ATP-dependent 6-phosphofructokinase [Pseudomonadota bacterium]
MVRRIGILTSGGDCAGLNAVIRGAALRAAEADCQLVGIRNGTMGLLARPPEADLLGPELADTAVLRRGGTMLGTTNRGDPFAFPMPDGRHVDRSEEVIAGYRLLGLDALIGIGGDGSFAILRRLAKQGGINLVGVPKTIDNDVDLTETSIGFPTAVEVATHALDQLQPTAASHSRVMVLELMGRDAGHIAISAGIAGGADVVLIPEIPWRLEKVKEKIEALRTAGRNFALIVAAEAVRTESGAPATVKLSLGEVRYGGIGHYLGHVIAEATGAETRVMVLGHLQRGGQPIAQDRVLGSAFGVRAVELVLEGRFDRMVALWHREVTDVPLDEAIRAPRIVERNGTLVRTARGLGICLGD